MNCSRFAPKQIARKRAFKVMSFYKWLHEKPVSFYRLMNETDYSYQYTSIVWQRDANWLCKQIHNCYRKSLVCSQTFCLEYQSARKSLRDIIELITRTSHMMYFLRLPAEIGGAWIISYWPRLALTRSLALAGVTAQKNTARALLVCRNDKVPGSRWGHSVEKYG